ncbi:hypothetical protein Patl1_22550 [Pistacia atlantica]|uniref:Uncharacterized protein n=1 Tax=Pistacia atlantica TaxID=434234 RepID=A0ACC0ZXH0_9ROSI|nr:hypothetical protein Patl1_22550 [Pistacia atlantica]
MEKVILRMISMMILLEWMQGIKHGSPSQDNKKRAPLIQRKIWSLVAEKNGRGSEEEGAQLVSNKLLAEKAYKLFFT